jgi:RNA polymerase sigma-70 factor (ECF subfamily)
MWSRHLPKGSGRFEEVVLPHLNAAYNLARWLTRDDSRAEDAVQEACLKAYSFFDSLRGDSRPWLLTIVRNTCYTMLKKERRGDAKEEFDEQRHEAGAVECNPERLRQRAADHERLHRALEQLPAEYREVLVLREFEDLSYRQIADVTGVPAGTVMSRLSRARQRLQAILLDERREV